MDVFGEQNLEEAVDAALEEQDQDRRISAGDEYLTIDVDDLAAEDYRDVFEALFNPVDGYIRDVPPDIGFQLKRRKKFVIGWGTEHIETYTTEISGEEIQEMQRASVEESFTEGYSPEKFREMYEER